MCPRLNTGRSKAEFFFASIALTTRLFRVPKRVRRPSAAREALCFSPLLKARRADTASIERVPFTAALAEPFVFLAGRPAAVRAPDAWRLRLGGLLFLFKLAVWNDDPIVGKQTHGCRSRSARCPPNTCIVLVPASTSPPWRTLRGIKYSSPALIGMRFPAISNL